MYIAVRFKNDSFVFWEKRIVRQERLLGLLGNGWQEKEADTEVVKEFPNEIEAKQYCEKINGVINLLKSVFG